MTFDKSILAHPGMGDNQGIYPKHEVFTSLHYENAMSHDRILKKQIPSNTGEKHLSDKLIKIAQFNTELNDLLGTDYPAFDIYRSKGLMAHLINRKHYIAAKYIDYLPEIISSPNYAGINNGNLELVKIYKDNIFLCIKLDMRKNRYYVATVFDVKMSKIASYMNSGRLKKLHD